MKTSLLARDEQRVLVCILQKATASRTEDCLVKRIEVAKFIGRSPRYTQDRIIALLAFGAISRARHGSTDYLYRILWDEKTLKSNLCSAYARNCSAFCSSRTFDHSDQPNPWKKKPVKSRNAEQNDEHRCSSLLLCDPPDPLETETIHGMIRPAYYRTPEEIHLWKLAMRWTSEHPQILIHCGADIGQIMTLLEQAGASRLPEDAALPAIAWPPEATPLNATREVVHNLPARKPMGIADADLEALRRQIGGQG